MRYITDELGFTASINYRTQKVDTLLGELCPNGIDIDLEMVGGTILDAIMRHLNNHARIVLLGQISAVRLLHPTGWAESLTVADERGDDHGLHRAQPRQPPAGILHDDEQWLREGKMKYREHIIDGLHNAKEDFALLFNGKSFGKLLIRVSPGPTV